MVTPDELREKATTFREAAKQIDVTALDLKPDRMIAAIVGHVTANVLDALAGTAEYLRPDDKLTVQRKRMMERNAAMRNAASIGAATGNWSEFDKLVQAEQP